MAVVPTGLTHWLELADQRLLAAWYYAASIRPARLRDGLRERRAPFVDPHRPASDTPPLVSLDRTAHALVAHATEAASRRSGLAGLAGAASIPSEVMVTTLTVLRLGQRLCVVYGFDPETDRGRMALCQALAAAYAVKLPATAPVGDRVSDLAAIVRSPAPPPTLSARLTRAVATHTARWTIARPSRWLPVFGARAQAGLARDHVQTAGERMVAVLRRLSEAPGLTRDHVEEAHEVSEP